MLVSLAALMVMSSILRWILQAFSNGQIPFLVAVFTPAIFQVSQYGWFIVQKHAVLYGRMLF